jgi:hypothetical protein
VPADVVLLLGCLIFNFIVCEIQVRLFSQALLEANKEEESLKIIDMFHGNVFIYDPSECKVLFVKRVQEEDYQLLNEGELRKERIFKITANFSLNSQKKDQVRLYDNVPSALPRFRQSGKL